MVTYDRNAWYCSSLSFTCAVLPRVPGRVGLLTALCLGMCVLDEMVLGPNGYRDRSTFRGRLNSLLIDQFFTAIARDVTDVCYAEESAAG